MKKFVKIECLIESGAYLPEYTTKEAAGADVRAFIEKAVPLLPNQRVLISTGLKFQIPEGFEIQVRPRSGLAYKYGITVLNSPGTIDSDYRGELKILLINLGNEVFVIEPKMRIAQVVVTPIVRADFSFVTELVSSERGDGGFGHTGVM